MKQALMVLIAGTLLSGLAAAWSATARSNALPVKAALADSAVPPALANSSAMPAVD